MLSRKMTGGCESRRGGRHERSSAQKEERRCTHTLTHTHTDTDTLTLTTSTPTLTKTQDFRLVN
uniref:Uncharacterized protein n=1 Tax=Anguilla anguilla TaxID=7936 RepID=A0A0E9VP51_ANGAN